MDGGDRSSDPLTDDLFSGSQISSVLSSPTAHEAAGAAAATRGSSPAPRVGLSRPPQAAPPPAPVQPGPWLPRAPLSSQAPPAGRPLLAAFLLAPLAAAQPWQLCGTSGNYSANDTYQSNLGQLSATLPKNASACDACVTTAFQDAQQICAFNKDATVFYDLYLLRFSNQNFLNTTNDNNFIITKNPQNVSAPAEVFDSAVTILLNATSNYAAANSSRRFATGEEAFASSNPTIYEVTPFFSGAPMLQLPAPLAPPAPENMTPPADTGGTQVH